MKLWQILIAGHGGQGVLELGNYVAYDALLQGWHAAYAPSYGPETRGGKVGCYVVLAPTEILSPVVDEVDLLVVMNLPSLEFEGKLRPGGWLLLNSSLVDRAPSRTDLEIVRIPATGLADAMRQDLAPQILSVVHDTRILANSVIYGAYLGLHGESFPTDRVERVFTHFLTGKRAAFIPANVAATARGYRWMMQSQRAPILRTS
jgi:2-oxoglutarate ferredoxin oxidoreductase subunit gamma